MRVIPAKTYQSPVVAQDDRSYEELKIQVFWITIAVAGGITPIVWGIYGTNSALSYCLGACTGMVYLRMLAKSVDRLGQESRGLGSPRLAIFIALMIVALRWEKLLVLPVFLGFITYKVAIVFYAVQDLMRSSRST